MLGQIISLHQVRLNTRNISHIAKKLKLLLGRVSANMLYYGHPRRLDIKEQWKGENFPSLEALRQRVNQELSQLSLSQLQLLTSFDFVLDALLQAAF